MNDPFGPATVRLIRSEARGAKPICFLKLSDSHRGSKRRSYQASRALLGCDVSELLRARRARVLNEISDALSASEARPPPRPLRLGEPFCQVNLAARATHE